MKFAVMEDLNTINTIQLLFLKEVDSRKEAVAAALNSRIANQPQNNIDKMSSSNDQANNNSNVQMTRRLRHTRRSEEARLSSRRRAPNQDADTALAFRLQRDEFMDIYRGSSLARENLRAMARRAMNLARNNRNV